MCPKFVDFRRPSYDVHADFLIESLIPCAPALLYPKLGLPKIIFGDNGMQFAVAKWPGNS
jgi:hypothetical protein